jgi:hypothetical protein
MHLAWKKSLWDIARMAYRSYSQLIEIESELKAILWRALEHVVSVQMEAVEELQNDTNQVQVNVHVGLKCIELNVHYVVC